MMNQKMFNSEVELGMFLGSTDVIHDAYKAILDTSSTYYIHTTPSGFKVLAFNSFPDYTNRFHNKEFDLVSSENHKAVDFISTSVNPKFSINEAAVELFDQLFVEISEISSQFRERWLIVTGRGLGGYLAILYTLWHQHVLDVEESFGSRTTKRPICITFGSPLLGDETLRLAISQRPTWKSCFLNVVAMKDALASFFSSDTLYKPVGNFLFCEDSGAHTTFEDEEAIMAVLDTMASSNAENISQLHDYRNNLESIREKEMYRGACELGELNLSSLKAGIVVQFMEISLLNNIPNNLITKMEEWQVKIIKRNRISNAYNPNKKFEEIKMSLTFMDVYMYFRRQKGGYYDSFKYAESRFDIMSQHEVSLHRIKLNQYWKDFIDANNQMPPKESINFRKRWLYAATSYRRIVEPLDIADYYKKGNTKYIENRPNHYKLLEDWLENDNRHQWPRDKKTKAASLNEDSCFWAYVEEALIKLRELKNGGPHDIATDLMQFEDYVLHAINDFTLSPEVFVEGSSLRKWWSEYKAYKGSSYDSEFARFMNNESYWLYK